MMQKATLILFMVSVLPVLVGTTCLGQVSDSRERDGHMLACMQYLELRDTKRAETRCLLCLEFDQFNPECLNNLGLVWYIRGVDDKARKYFIQAIRENNDFVEARNNLGVLEFDAGNYQKAKKMFASAVEIAPSHIDSRYNLALSSLRLGQQHRGQQMAKNAESRDFQEELLHYDDAEVEYRKLFEIAPKHVSSYHDMGVIETYRAASAGTENVRQLYISSAQNYLSQCLQLEPGHETCHENLGHLYLAIGQCEKALYHHFQCLATNPQNPTCKQESLSAYSCSALQDSSITQYIDQVRDNPGHAPSHYGLCQAFFAKGLVELAAAECRNTLLLDPGHCMAHYQLAEHSLRVLDKVSTKNHCRAFLQCAGDSYPEQTAACQEALMTLQ